MFDYYWRIGTIFKYVNLINTTVFTGYLLLDTLYP